jgi:hypothetical protein
MDYVTNEGSAKGFVVGQNIPLPTDALNGSFVIVSQPGTPASPAPTQPVGSGDWIVCDAPPAQWVVIPIGRFIVASQVIFNPYSYVTATDVQTAIQEVINRTTFFSLATGTGLSGGPFTLAGGAQTINLLPPSATVIGGVKAGSNILIGPDGTISAVAGGAVGTITGVVAGNGLIGGGTSGSVILTVGAGTGITSGVGSVSITNTGVTAGSYTNANITVNAQGQITTASNGADQAYHFATLDNISAGFNGTTTTFNLTIGAVAYTPNPISNIMVFIGGIAQTPTTSYSISGSQITFTEAPAAGASFYATTVRSA